MLRHLLRRRHDAPAKQPAAAGGVQIVQRRIDRPRENTRHADAVFAELEIQRPGEGAQETFRRGVGRNRRIRHPRRR